MESIMRRENIIFLIILRSNSVEEDLNVLCNGELTGTKKMNMLLGNAGS